MGNCGSRKQNLHHNRATTQSNRKRKFNPQLGHGKFRYYLVGDTFTACNCKFTHIIITKNRHPGVWLLMMIIDTKFKTFGSKKLQVIMEATMLTT